MEKEQYELFTKVHNELIKRLRIDADKYARQDSFSAIIDVENGDAETAYWLDLGTICMIICLIVEAFKAVYDVEVTDKIYNSCYTLCIGWK